MRGKLLFLGGAAVGFVLGARAGREKYDQLVATGRRVWESPTVQEAAGVVQAQANRFYTEGKNAVSEKLSQSRLGERFGRSTEVTDVPATTTTTTPTKSTSSTTTANKSTPSTASKPS
jgi:hypothetical protein